MFYTVLLLLLLRDTDRLPLKQIRSHANVARPPQGLAYHCANQTPAHPPATPTSHLQPYKLLH